MKCRYIWSNNNNDENDFESIITALFTLWRKEIKRFEDQEVMKLLVFHATTWDNLWVMR
jgi:hypothetical protein